MNCPEQKRFWCQDGRTLKNLDELGNALQSMTEKTYRHHVSEGKNDFANWTEHVFGKKKLAEEMRKVKTKKEMAKAVINRNKKERAKKTDKKAEKKATKKKATKTKKSKTIKKRVKKRKERMPALDEKYLEKPEGAHTHIAFATHIALGIVVGSAITLLVLMLM